MATKVTKIIPPGVRNPSRRTISSTLLKDSMTYTTYSHETNGEYTEFTSTIQPGFDNPPHYHTQFVETFTCTQGALSVTLDNKPLLLKPGDIARVEIGHVHSLANSSAEEAKFTTKLEPGNEGFEKAMYIMHGLANDGLTNGDGIPTNPAQLAVLAGMMDTWLTGPLFLLARPLLLGLRRYGAATGMDRRLLGSYWDSD